MKTNETHNSRSEHAKNEKRDSQGRFVASGKDSKKDSKTTSQLRSENAKNEKRDSHGRFESDSKK